MARRKRSPRSSRISRVQSVAGGRLADSIDGIAGGALALRSVNMLFHPVLYHGEKIGFEARPFLLASRKRPDIVTSVLMLVEKLNRTGLQAGCFPAAVCMTCCSVRFQAV